MGQRRGNLIAHASMVSNELFRGHHVTLTTRDPEYLAGLLDIASMTPGWPWGGTLEIQFLMAPSHKTAHDWCVEQGIYDYDEKDFYNLP
jgi:hypothetical protein